MRPLYFILPTLLGGLFACSSIQEAPQPVSAPTLDKGVSFFNTNNDSAFYYFNLVATTAGNDSLDVAMAYTYMGIIQAYEGDQYGGQESLLKSLSFLDDKKPEDYDCLSANYHELGNICLNLKNYDAAIGYVQNSFKYIKHPEDEAIANNSIALIYQKKGDYDRAAALYKYLLKKSKDKSKEFARILSNYAKTQWLKDSTYPAGPELQYALRIRRDSNDVRGLNASYAHLSDFYTVSAPDSALYYAGKRYEAAQEMNSPDDQVEALSKLIALSPAHSLKTYFVRYQFLTDSLQTARNAAKNQFALIRFEAEKSKADNLQLQKDNAHRKTQLVVLWFVFTAIVLLAVFIVVSWARRSRRRRQKIEDASRQEIQAIRLRTSQRVHDVVANGLYRVMTEVEHEQHIDKEKLIDKIEELYEQSRDISYEGPVASSIPFHVKMDDLLKSFGSGHIKVAIFGNGPGLWEQVNTHVQIEMAHILQELMVNMKKHSNAQSVMIKFGLQDGRLRVLYTDDGIGLSPQISYGNGLKSTGNRIERNGGEITFEHPEKGVRIHISFPTA
ncbi:tetratricopeptide repeat-containing sensor histidine kinase [Chitinophaga rhizosphaerae]|uniref:tetratricopeptide repeat-containing sensor histidine kinase n=1 Tax=Chitinophaga rhizosphaerae TaxID=1864947 RepID=UPI000F800BE9|nr:tetratricopeptide repeat-containing sensor histidine kinase [Chitinophaga rhizosphaerae]